MSTKTKISCLVAGCLLVGVCAGAVGAQVVADAARLRFLNSGLFVLDAGEDATFHVTLADNRAGAPVRVLVQFLDRQGASVARQEVVLQAGQSTSLTTAGPGEVRAHARVMDGSFDLSARRAIVGGIDVLDLTTRQRRPVCSIDENGSSGAGRQ
jgi:hypothetical protein